jgi:hypothetical protein
MKPMKPALKSLGPALGAALLSAISMSACEVHDDGVGAATPQNAPMDVPPPAPPSPATAGPEQPSAPQTDAQYASGEYAIGENSDAYDDNDPAALKDFRGTLDPYGTWADDPTYGTVWVPATSAVGADFAPYSTAGHWVYDDDWVWVSDYPWGWAPFHYGRWVLIEGRGWAWIPGRVYRGAWVTWAVDDDYSYVGWAPMGPAFVWFGGYAVAYGVYVGPRWVYCPRGEVFSPGVHARIVMGAAAAPIAAHMRTYVAATPGVGPAPARLGYPASSVPHAAGASAQSIQRAQTFARPSTAQAVGGSVASRVAGVAGPTRTVNETHPAISESRPASRGVAPQALPRSGAMPTPSVAPARPATVAPVTRVAPQPFRGAPAPHTGGGGHHR